ncbi:hypothetical protein EBR66_04230 [bacterium]|nr:hypothetical protein [bacterium]
MSSSFVEIIPAIIPNTKAELDAFIEKVSSFAPVIHLDVNDGVFVPAVSWPCAEGQWEELEKAAQEKRVVAQGAFDVHLMMSDPVRAGALFARAGSRTVLGHIEAFQNAQEIKNTLQYWKKAGAQKVGVTLLLDTPLSKFAAISDVVDTVQLMSIARVGFQKQPFEENIYERIAELHALYPALPIMIDGAVNQENVSKLSHAGVTHFVVGSAILRAADPHAAYEEIKAAV